MGLNGIRAVLDLAGTAYALVQGCHLGRIKAYDLKFLGLISTRLDPDLGLRHVNALEAQAADRMLLAIVSRAVASPNPRRALGVVTPVLPNGFRPST